MGILRRFLLVGFVLAWGTSAWADGFGQRLLEQRFKNLAVALADGARPDAALAELAENLHDSRISRADIEGYLKARMSPRAYAAFAGELENALRGVDPETVAPEELAEILAPAYAHARSGGLAWQACDLGQWAGIGVSGYGMVTFFIHFIKSRAQDASPELVHDERIDMLKAAGFFFGGITLTTLTGCD